ncbi:MAG: hypothetical protein IJD91_06110 [Clostridia bacterium]|nr:hypothetical protein [Clostridia bacterium]
MIFRYDMIVAINLILLAVLVAGSIESNLREAFSGDWMRFDEQKEPKESNIEMDNSEFDWGHNVKHRTEDDYE